MAAPEIIIMRGNLFQSTIVFYNYSNFSDAPLLICMWEVDVWLTLQTPRLR